MTAPGVVCTVVDGPIGCLHQGEAGLEVDDLLECGVAGICRGRAIGATEVQAVAAIDYGRASYLSDGEVKVPSLAMVPVVVILLLLR